MALGADEGAKVTIVEYASATCPHCAAFHKDVWPKLKAEYVDTKKIRFIFREFPLNDRGARRLHDRPRGAEGSLFPADRRVLRHARDLGAEPGARAFSTSPSRRASPRRSSTRRCKNEALAKGIMEIRDGGAKFGVKGTPTFFINGKLFEGERTFDDIQGSDRPAPLRGGVL